MNDKQRKVLMSAYNSFNVETGYHDYEVIGKILVIRRMLAEILGLSLRDNVMPGEGVDDDDDVQEKRFIGENDLSSNEEKSLTKSEQNLLRQVLGVSKGMYGVTDGDDACIRCARRMIAEVAGEPIEYYRLMMEKEVKPLYYKEYKKSAD